MKRIIPVVVAVLLPFGSRPRAVGPCRNLLLDMPVERVRSVMRAAPGRSGVMSEVARLFTTTAPVGQISTAHEAGAEMA